MDPLASTIPYLAIKTSEPVRQLYQKLPSGSARFLRFKEQRNDPQTSKSALIFELEVHSVQQDILPYSALSYTWGHPIIDDFQDDFQNSIICSERRLPVGLNLYGALQHLFVNSNAPPALLWIDAICINQNDLDERAQQVSMMTLIYSNAVKVIVWLGVDDADAHEAHAFLSQYVPAVRAELTEMVMQSGFATFQQDRCNFFDDTALHAKHGIPTKTLEQWKSLLRFFSRRWFKRIWVAQEVVFNDSRVICCGPLTFDWEELDIFVMCIFGALWHGGGLHGLEKDILDIASAFTLFREIRLGANDELNELHLNHLDSEAKSYAYAQHFFLQSSIMQATDPRDRVYALSAFVHSIGASLKCEIPWPIADYAVQPTTVMLRTAQILLEKAQSLDLLSYVSDIEYRTQSDLPSWLPHFHISGAVNAVETLLRVHQGRNYHAGSLSINLPTRPDISVHLETSELHTQGYMLDTVTEVGCLNENDGFVPIIDICLRLPIQYHNGEPPLEVMWRTLIAGRTDTQFPAPPETAASFALYIKLLFLSRATMAISSGNRNTLLKMFTLIQNIEQRCPHPTIPTFAEFQELLQKHMADPMELVQLGEKFRNSFSYRTFITPTHKGQKGKAVVRTAKGYLGLAPYSTEVGDQIWLFKGAKVLHVLRKSANSSKSYVGESYMHGFMAGEAMRLAGMSWSLVSIK